MVSSEAPGMTHNPPAEGDLHSWIKLWREARLLSDADVSLLEEQALADPENLETRIKLLSLYNEYAGKELKREGAEQKLSKQVLWLIENKPALTGFLGSRLTATGYCFRPKTFATLRQAWLEQVSATPNEAAVLGNAAKFIAWIDIETAADLFERAYALQPEEGWLRTLLMHYNSQLFTSPLVYKEEICKRIVDIGVRSLQSEPGDPSFTCEYVSEAALILGRLDIVRWCAQILQDWDNPACEQMANAYLGLAALRENDRDLAVELMLRMKRGYHPQEIVFRLARELFDKGERESIVQLVRSFKRKVRASARNRWLKQIANDERPDFQDYCCCRSCMARAMTGSRSA